MGRARAKRWPRSLRACACEMRPWQYWTGKTPDDGVTRERESARHDVATSDSGTLDCLNTLRRLDMPDCN